MRAFSIFLSLFTLLFFLAPVFCLTKEASNPAVSDRTIRLPEEIPCREGPVPAAEFLVERLAALDLKGYRPEALKAAAVAVASELTVHYATTGSGDGLARISGAQAKKAWGDYWFSQYWPALQKAVASVWGEILTEGDAPFSPAFFPLSWGQTAEGIPCPYDFTAEGFETEITVSAAEAEAFFPQYKTSLTVKKAQNDRVETVTSGNTVRTGIETAENFRLPSLCFSASAEEDRLIFRCRGRGNGEGMSLYAANEMAKRGSGYEEILARFYPQASLRK